MSVIGLHVDAGSQDGHAPIVMLRGIIDQPLRDRSSMMPQQLARSRVKGVRIICAGDEHNARNDDRRHLEGAYSARMEDPLRSELINIGRCDLGEAAEAVPTIVTIVGRPVVTQFDAEQIGLRHINCSQVYVR